MPQKKRRRVSGSAVTTEFLQQARLGKDKATAGGSGIEKIVGAKASSALPLDGIGNANEIRHMEGNNHVANAPRSPHPGAKYGVEAGSVPPRKATKSSATPTGAVNPARAIRTSGNPTASRVGAVAFNRR